MTDPDLMKEAESQIRAFVRRKARQFADGPVKRHDRADLAQHLRLAVLQRLTRIDPTHGRPAAFLSTVLRRVFLDLMRQRFARCRDPRRSWPLARALNEAGELPDDVDARRPDPGRWQTEADLRLDVAAALATLDPQDRNLAERLMHDRPGEIARALGLTWPEMLARLRRLRKQVGEGLLGRFLD